MSEHLASALSGAAIVVFTTAAYLCAKDSNLPLYLVFTFFLILNVYYIAKGD